MTQLKPQKYTSELISDMDGSQLKVKAASKKQSKHLSMRRKSRNSWSHCNVRKEKNTSKFGMRTSKLRRTK